VFYIHYGDIHATYKNAVLDFDTEMRIPVLNKNIKPGANFLKEGDLIIADASEDYDGVGEALEVYNLRDKVVLAGLHTFALRDNSNKTAHGYRAYIFKNHEVKNRLKTIATGSKVYGISKGNLTKFKITLPPYEEQQKIAQILSTWDKAILLQQQLITKKKLFKTSIIKQLLNCVIRFDGFEDEWKYAKIGKVFETQAGKDIDLNSYQTSKSETHIFPLYSNALQNEGLYGWYDRFQYDGGKITVTARGNLGMAIPRFEKFNAIGRLLILTPKDEINIKYASDYINNIMNIYIESTGVPQLTAPQFSIYKIKLPKINEQVKIANYSISIDNEINVLQRQLVAMQEQKKGLMQQLLTGKVRLKI
jgi:type I restriction enzyme S subunit